MSFERRRKANGHGPSQVLLCKTWEGSEPFSAAKNLAGIFRVAKRIFLCLFILNEKTFHHFEYRFFCLA